MGPLASGMILEKTSHLCRPLFLRLKRRVVLGLNPVSQIFCPLKFTEKLFGVQIPNPFPKHVDPGKLGLGLGMCIRTLSAPVAWYTLSSPAAPAHHALQYPNHDTMPFAPSVMCSYKPAT